MNKRTGIRGGVKHTNLLGTVEKGCFDGKV